MDPEKRKVVEVPLPKTKKPRAKKVPSQEEDAAKDILRAVKKAATKPAIPRKKAVEFYIGDNPSEKRKASFGEPKRPKNIRVR